MSEVGVHSMKPSMGNWWKVWGEVLNTTVRDGRWQGQPEATMPSHVSPEGRVCSVAA